MSQRPKLAPVSEEMRHISALLEQELLGWPGVSARPMFGMRSIDRGTAIFAMLPDRRALEKPGAIACKLAGGAEKSKGPKWHLFELKTSRTWAWRWLIWTRRTGVPPRGET